MFSPELQVALRVFRALSAERRLEIIRLLARGALCVGALSDLLGISAGGVSQHLRILEDAGLAGAERRGYYLHYKLTLGAAERCRGAVRSIFARGEASKAGTAKPARCPRLRKACGRRRA